MSGSGKGVLGVVGISRNEVGAGTFPDKGGVINNGKRGCGKVRVLYR